MMPRSFPALFLVCLIPACASLTGCSKQVPERGDDPEAESSEAGPAAASGVERNATASELAARPRPAIPHARNILLVTVDTLRADHLGCYGYSRATSPRMDAFAREGTLFRDAQSQRSLTWPSLSTILTGLYPRTHGVRRNGDRLDPSVPSLPRILSAAGWTTASAAASMKTAPNPGVDVRFVSDTKQSWPEQDRQVARAASAWIEQQAGRPWFLWVHFIGPHDPYAPDPPFQTMFGAPYAGKWDGSAASIDRITSSRIDLAPEDLDHIISLYDGEIRATDALFGQLLDTLERLGLTQGTTVLLSADHGEELYQRNYYFQHGCSVYDSTLHVPLIVRSPGKIPAGRVLDPLVELVDVAPTLLALAGEGTTIGGLEGAEGIDLTPLLLATEPPPGQEPWPRAAWGSRVTQLPSDRFVGGHRFSVAEYRDKIMTLRTDEWRYIWNPEEFHPHSGAFKLLPADKGYPVGREELYRTATDPLEKTNVLAAHADVALALRAALLDWASRRSNVLKPREMSAETKEELRSLGYIR